MTNLVKNLTMIILISTGLVALGIAVNNTGIWSWLTNFFILFRTIVKPLSFLWDFQTTFEIIGVMLGLMTAIYTFKGIMMIKNFFD